MLGVRTAELVSLGWTERASDRPTGRAVDADAGWRPLELDPGYLRVSHDPSSIHQRKPPGQKLARLTKTDGNATSAVTGDAP
jgi:hypothetical protein